MRERPEQIIQAVPELLILEAVVVEMHFKHQVEQAAQAALALSS
jgi:hypothetical protein